MTSIHYPYREYYVKCAVNQLPTLVDNFLDPNSNGIENVLGNL